MVSSTLDIQFEIKSNLLFHTFHSRSSTWLKCSILPIKNGKCCWWKLVQLLSEHGTSWSSQPLLLAIPFGHLDFVLPTDRIFHLAPLLVDIVLIACLDDDGSSYCAVWEIGIEFVVVRLVDFLITDF